MNNESANTEDRINQLESELAESQKLINEFHKDNGLREILASKGFTSVQISEALPQIKEHVARQADGSLSGVNEALAYLAKVRPDLTKQKVAEHKPTNTAPQHKGYTPPAENDEKAARKIFGPGSDARQANALAMTAPAEYQRLKTVAKVLQLVA